MFGNLSVTTTAPVSEIDEYLRLPVENVTDPLKWWSDNRHAYPCLSRMALDFLSAPRKSCLLIYNISDLSFAATSTAVERVFSQGRHLLSHTRNALSSQSLRSFLCLGSWSRRDLVVMKDLIDAVRANMGKKKAAHADGAEDVEIVE